MNARERREHRRKPARVQVFAPPPVVDVGRAGRFYVARSITRPLARKPARVQVFAPPVVVDVGRAWRFYVQTATRAKRPRKPARWQVFAPPAAVDVGRAGRFFAYRTRAQKPRARRPSVVHLFKTGATPPAPVSGDLRRLLLGVGL